MSSTDSREGFDQAMVPLESPGINRDSANKNAVRGAKGEPFLCNFSWLNGMTRSQAETRGAGNVMDTLDGDEALRS